MALTKEELDKIALEYHGKDEMHDKHIEDMCQFYTYDWVFSHLRGSEKVLELGFGEGNFTEELSKQEISLTVVEGSSVLVEKAKEIYGNRIRFECALFEQYKPQNKFDVIVATHVLEHVDDPVSLLKTMKNWLNDNGKIIIIVPNRESIHRQLAVIMGLQPTLDTLGERDHLVGHQRVYSLDTLGADVTNAGLKIMEEEGFFLKLLPNSMMLGFKTELLEALNKISFQLPDRLLANIGIIAKI
jgi:2-polyprenyl-3-methyl-5-hydroxy-6-metoxy-1,4-benzoquinol methylase